MKVLLPNTSILDRLRQDNANAEFEKIKGLIDYNVMMETLEDPSEDEGDEDE